MRIGRRKIPDSRFGNDKSLANHRLNLKSNMTINASSIWHRTSWIPWIEYFHNLMSRRNYRKCDGEINSKSAVIAARLIIFYDLAISHSALLTAFSIKATASSIKFYIYYYPRCTVSGSLFSQSLLMCYRYIPLLCSHVLSVGSRIFFSPLHFHNIYTNIKFNWSSSTVSMAN